MNTPSPQQQTQQQQQQRQKMMQLPQYQKQLLAQQQFRQSLMTGLEQLHGQQQQMQFSQQLGNQQFQSRQLPSGHVQHGLGQSQFNQGNQLNRHLSQFSGTANSALFNAAQTTPNTQMISNMSATMPSQSLLPRIQFGMSSANSQRSHASQVLSDQMFNMGAANAGSMMPLQQQHGSHGSFGNMPSNTQNVQSGMGSHQNTQQSHPNFSQQRQPNQQQ